MPAAILSLGGAIRAQAIDQTGAGVEVDRQIVIRLYQKESADPAAYEGQVLTLEHDNLILAPSEAARFALAGDQEDPEVARRLGKVVYLLPREGNWLLPAKPLDLKPSPIFDARNMPLPAQGVTVTVLTGSGPRAEHLTSLDGLVRAAFTDLERDGQGRPLMPLVAPPPGMDEQFRGTTISHPDYGTVITNYWIRAEWGLSNPRLPLVKKGSDAHARALRGQALTRAGMPLAEAVVECDYVRLAGGAALSAQGSRVLTDQNGEFSIYLPGGLGNFEFKGLIPEGAEYGIKIFPPRRYDLPAFVGAVANTEPAKIVMEDLPFRTFVFETATGRVSGLDLEKIILNGPAGRVRPEVVRNGGKVPFGSYGARYNEHGNSIDFPYLKIGPESPREIVFQTLQGKQYAGRVIDGATSAPVAGALVFGTVSNQSGRKLPDLTDAEWAALHALPERPDTAAEALDPLRKRFGISWVVRSGADGSWHAADREGKQTYNAVVFAQNRLGFQVRVLDFKPGDDGWVHVPDLRLYWAARVTGQTLPKALYQPLWVIDRESNPAWAIEMADFVNGKRYREGKFGYDEWSKDSGLIDVEVPAGVRLRLNFSSDSDESLGQLTIPETLLLQPGQRFDLGAISIPPSVLTGVQVVDESGAPVVGFPVRKQTRENHFGSAHITDADGMVYFIIPPAMDAIIGTFDYGAPAGEPTRHMITVNITGHENPPPIFTLQLSGAAIERIRTFKP